MIISKDIKFDCAHMLSNYEGKCANLHGHTYHGTISITGSINDTGCMVVDYNVIKKKIEPFDHAIIFSAPEYRGDAENDLMKWADEHNMHYLELPFGKSTAETLAQLFASMFQQYGNVTVRLSETDGSWAEAHA